jgi:hypothetical protein
MMDTREAVARAICLESGEPDEVDPFGWSEYLPDADAAIAAHLKALADAGLIVVPREPTEAMGRAAYDLLGGIINDHKRAYRAMIQAVDNG